MTLEDAVSAGYEAGYVKGRHEGYRQGVADGYSEVFAAEYRGYDIEIVDPWVEDHTIIFLPPLVWRTFAPRRIERRESFTEECAQLSRAWAEGKERSSETGQTEGQEPQR